MESWRIALLPEYFKNGIISLLVKKSSTTSLNHCYRKLHSLNHYVKACESLQRQLQLLSCTPSISSFLYGKLFALRHQHNLYSCYWLGSSLVPGNLISDEMIKFREGLFFETDSQLYAVEMGLYWMHVQSTQGDWQPTCSLFVFIVWSCVKAWFHSARVIVSQ